MKKTTFNLAAVVSAALLVTGCGHYKPLPLRNPATDAEAGSLDVAMVSAVPFEAVRADFASKFELKPADALNEALITTQATQASVNKTTQFLLSAALPGADAPSASASAPTSPTAPSPKAPDSLGAAATAPGTAGVSQHNAMLRYRLASALMQEVAMLNSYVLDAPRRAGFDPFIVRLQVTVRPRARATPFDAQSDIAFSTSAGPAPVVVPLLASDNEDATSASSLDRNLTQIGLALSALKGAYGLGASLSGNAEDIVSSLGWQYQNVSNVARIDDQTISLRVNAQPTGVNRFELTSRVHYVTVLLLVKRPDGREGVSNCVLLEGRPCLDVGFRATTRFVHAITGKAPGEALEQQGASEPRVQAGGFQLFFWPDPVLPADHQIAPLVFGGKKPAYSAQLKLRGGDNLTTQTVLRATLRATVLAPSMETGAKSACPPVAKKNKAQEVCPPDRTELLQLEATKVALEPGLRDTLLLTFNDLSEITRAKLGKAGQLHVTLALGPDARRAPSCCHANTMVLRVTPDPIFSEPDEPQFKSGVVTDARLTVSGQGAGTLGVAVKFPAGADAGKVKVVAVAFENVLPAGITLPAGALAGSCAKIEKGQVVVSKTCDFKVDLKNLPLPPQATPVAMKVSASEYADETKPATATKSLGAVSLQYSVASTCVRCSGK